MFKSLFFIKYLTNTSTTTMSKQKHMTTWVLIYLCVSTASTDLVTCDANTTCQIGFYCSQGYCEMCADCESRGRQPPPPTYGNICAEKEGDCGPCLKEYMEKDMTTDGSRKGKCSPMESYSISFRDVADVLGVLAFAIVIIALALGVWFFRNRLWKICSSCRKPESRNSDSNQVNPDGGNLSNGHVKSETNGIHSNETTVV